MWDILVSDQPWNVKLIFILIDFLVLSIAFSVHEFSHAWVAYKLGDDTPYYMGRVTLNPLAHLDPIGTVLLFIIGIGWGKPVVFNPSNIDRIKNRRLGVILVSVAGVTANFITALISGVVMAIFLHSSLVSTTLGSIFLDFLMELEIVSISLLAFNLIPIPPLDGFNILQELLPLNVKYSNGFRTFVANAPRYFFLIILIGNFTNISIIGYIMKFISYPFIKIIDGVCNLVYSIF